MNTNHLYANRHLFYHFVFVTTQVLLANVHAVVILHAKITQEISNVIRGKKAHLPLYCKFQSHFLGFNTLLDLYHYLYTYLILCLFLSWSCTTCTYVVLGITHALKLNKMLEINHGKLITKSSTTTIQQFHFAFFNVILVLVLVWCVISISYLLLLSLHHSCSVGSNACESQDGVVGNNSCRGSSACYDNAGNIFGPDSW